MAPPALGTTAQTGREAHLAHVSPEGLQPLRPPLRPTPSASLCPRDPGLRSPSRPGSLGPTHVQEMLRPRAQPAASGPQAQRTACPTSRCLGLPSLLSFIHWGIYGAPAVRQALFPVQDATAPHGKAAALGSCEVGGQMTSRAIRGTRGCLGAGRTPLL